MPRHRPDPGTLRCRRADCPATAEPPDLSTARNVTACGKTATGAVAVIAAVVGCCTVNVPALVVVSLVPSLVTTDSGPVVAVCGTTAARGSSSTALKSASTLLNSTCVAVVKVVPVPVIVTVKPTGP